MTQGGAAVRASVKMPVPGPCSETTAANSSLQQSTAETVSRGTTTREHVADCSSGEIHDLRTIMLLKYRLTTSIFIIIDNLLKDYKIARYPQKCKLGKV